MTQGFFRTQTPLMKSYSMLETEFSAIFETFCIETEQSIIQNILFPYAGSFVAEPPDVGGSYLQNTKRMNFFNRGMHSSVTELWLMFAYSVNE